MPDFGFVGPAYEASSKFQDAQTSINYYVEEDATPGAKEHLALYQAPGKTLFATLNAGGPVRGCWTLPGGQSSVWVSGNTAYLITAAGIVSILGTLQTSTGPVSIRDNTFSVFIVDGTYGYVYNISANTFTQTSDAGFLGATNVEFADGWMVFNKPSSRVFYLSKLYQTSFDATFFASKEGDSDNLVRHIFNARELWLLGERTTELWYNTGAQNFPYQRMDGIFFQAGCAAAQSVAKLDTGIIWLGLNERGKCVVYRTVAQQLVRASNHAIENALSKYSTISDALGWVYQQNGHEFYVLTFPAADVTWVYDTATNMWHQRATMDANTSILHRDRANCVCVMNGLTLVGDVFSGNVYKLDLSSYVDYDRPLFRQRRAPHIQHERKRIRHHYLQVEFEPGQGLQTGQGSSPVAMMRFSDDGGQTWGNIRTCSLGRVGEYKNRAIFRRLGYARDRVYELTVTDPVSANIIGATLEADGGMT